MAAPAQAQPATPESSTGDSLRISVLTFAPGETYWQRFGHNAILVENTVTGANAVYNYGMFDFFQKNFFLNFARGYMVYRLDVDSLDRTLALYASEGRWVYQQVLALDAAQRLQLAVFLDHNARPENADYRYDYFRDNCSTRVRDALDTALGGALSRPFGGFGRAFSCRGVLAHEAGRTLLGHLGRVLGLLHRGQALVGAPRVGDRTWHQAHLPFQLLLDQLRQAAGPAGLRLFAELPGPRDEQGQSPFWHGLGQHFFAFNSFLIDNRIII